MKVIIVGAGPSGLVLALLLASQGISVTVLEAGQDIDDRPRAAMYAPSAVRVLRTAGVLDDVRAEGFTSQNISWRKPNGERIGGLKDIPSRNRPDHLAVLPLDKLGRLLVRHAEKREEVTLRWGVKVANVEQGEGKAWANLENGEKVEGDYLVGCDGANSIVRKTLYGSEYPGRTWDAQTVATNVYYPFEKFGFDDINFIIDKEDYYMAARITNDGLWRVTYGEPTSMTAEEVRAHQPAKYEKMLPGHPKPGSGEYKVISVGPYRIHQRCAPKFRVGRILLAADAAHLCNPWGGLGLTGGLVDVGGLGECLGGIALGVAGDDILDRYSEVRRKMWTDIIDPFSSNNYLRVSQTDAETAAEQNEFLVMAKKSETDDVLRKAMDDSSYDICHDFKQYYTKVAV